MQVHPMYVDFVFFLFCFVKCNRLCVSVRGDNILVLIHHQRMSCNGSYRVIIVGGGIIGLTTACTLLKEYASSDNLKLTIISDTFSPETTGDVSAGFWEPYGMNLDDQRILDWARYTYYIFMSEYFSTKAAQAGIIKLSAFKMKSQEGQEAGNNDAFNNPSFLSLVRHYRVLTDPEISMFDHLGPITGYVMSSMVTEVRRYLPQLQRFLEQDPRVKFIKKRICSLSELKDEADVVINCSGLGARDLVGDLAVRPARGQVRSIDFLCFCLTLAFCRSFESMLHGSNRCIILRQQTKAQVTSFHNQILLSWVAHFS
jgi:glycine/D-amino acid oxidase-like deaminating enzyme